MQGPGRVGQVRPGDGAQVGAAGGDDAVDLVCLGDRAHGDGTDAHFVADAVGKRGLVHAAVDRFGCTRGLTGGHVDHVAAGGFEQFGDGDTVIRRVAALRPVVRREAHAHGQMRWPSGADGGEDFQRVAAAVFYSATVLVCADIRQWRQEAGEQVAVGAVQFQPVKTGVYGTMSSGDEFLLQQIHIRTTHRFGGLVLFAISHSTSRQQRPIAAGKGFVSHLPAQLGGAFGAAMAELQADFGAALAVNKIGNPFKSQRLRIVPQAGTGGGDTAFGCRAGHFHHHQSRAAQGSGTQMDKVEVLHHAVHRAVGRHGGDDDAVFESGVAYFEGQQHRRQIHPFALSLSKGLRGIVRVL